MKKIFFIVIIYLTVNGQDLNFPIDTIAYNNLFNNRQFVAQDIFGRLHISYTGQLGTDGATREIYYVKENSDGSFSTLNITNNNVDDNYSTLSLDLNQKVHIGFTGRDANNLFQIKYTNNVNGSFAVPMFITTGGLNKATPYSKIGPDSVMHFVYFTFTNDPDNIYYRSYDLRTGTLSNEQLLTAGETGGDFDAALDVDINGKVHIVVKSGGVFGGPLKYYNNISGSLTEIPTSASGNITGPKVLVDLNGVVHIVYRLETGTRLHYINNQSGNFSTPIPITPVGQRPAGGQNLAMDDNFRLYVCYQSSQSASGRGFYLVHGKGGDFSDTIRVWEITPEYLLRNSSSVTARGNGRIAYLFAPSASRSGQVVCDIFMKRGSLFGEAIISVDKDTLNFGSTVVGSHIVDTLTIMNNGTDTLVIYSLINNNPSFSVPLFFTDIIIFPGESFYLPITFLPMTSGTHYDTLQIFSNADNFNPYSVFLEGIGLSTPKFTPLKDTLYCNENTFWNDTLYFINSGEVALVIDSVVVLSDNPEFPVCEIIYSQTVVQPDSQSYIWFIFLIPIPDIRQNFLDSLYIYSNDPDSPTRIYISWTEPPIGIKENNIIATGYKLFQNYPNPFNPSTIIKFSVPSEEKIHRMSLPLTIKVYDVLGNEIVTLINTEKKSGVYEVEFDGSQIPSGVYFYQMKTENFVQTKKMILMK